MSFIMQRGSTVAWHSSRVSEGRHALFGLCVVETSKL